MPRTLLLTTAFLAASAGAALADCTVSGDEEITGMTSTFPAYVAIRDAMEACPNVSIELDLEVRTKAAPAIAANPSLYDIVSVHNDTIVQFLNAGTLRPLDDLVEQYGGTLNDNQLIRINGEIMAIALFVNVKNFMYREDIFADLGLEPPRTYDDMLAAAEAVREAGVVEFPMAMTYKGDWNLAAAFNDLFAANGGEFVDEENRPLFNSEAGLKSLETLARTAEYLDPEYLVSDSTTVQQQLQQGKTAMAILWASRAAAMDDPLESEVVGKIAGSAAPLVDEDGLPAAMLYWDGLAIAANISDAEAEKAFRVIVDTLDEDMVRENSDAAIWIAKGYEPARMAQAAIDTIGNGVVSSPSTSWKGLAISAAEKTIPSFLIGDRTAEQTLVAMEEDYLVAAREAGLVD